MNLQGIVPKLAAIFCVHKLYGAAIISFDLHLVSAWYHISNYMRYAGVVKADMFRSYSIILSSIVSVISMSSSPSSNFLLLALSI